jgi:hypothetical protein
VDPTDRRQLALQDTRLRDYQSFLLDLKDRDPPGLFFMHVALPHLPWRYLPSGRLYGGLPRHLMASSNPWQEVPWYPLLAYQRHMCQVKLVDNMVTELLHRLDALTLFDQALLVVTSDHGASHWPGSSRRIPLESAHPEDILGIPLFIKLPHQSQAGIDDTPAETVDILPTVAQALDVDLTEGVDGRSLLDPSLPIPEKRWLGTRDHLVAVTTAFLPDGHSLRRKHELFPRRRGAWRLYGPGPYGDLVGMALEEIEHGPVAEIQAALHPSSRVVVLDPGAPYVNVLLTGDIAAFPGRDEVQIAVGIGGRVAGVATAPLSPDGATFAVLAAEDLLEEGPNPAHLFLVEGDPETPVLRSPATLAP